MNQKDAKDENASLRRGIRLDLMIAVCALVISSAATGASWWQSRVVADQLSAQVWPYLSISTTYDRESVEVDVINDGLGPAIIRSTVLTVDGKPYADPVQAFRAFVPRVRGRRFGSQMSDLGPGSVIRSSSSVRLFRLNARWVVPIVARNYKRIDVRTCYCSLLGNCWEASIRQQTDPTPVRRCPDVGASQYKVPVIVNS